MIDLTPVQDLWPDADTALLQGIIDSDALDKLGFDPISACHLMAQCSVECEAGTRLEENLNYSASRLMAVWPRRFNEDRANECAHNPARIAEAVYTGRMGNDQPGDGYKFRGQGLLMSTGKSNYSALAQITGLDLLNTPELIVAPATALLVAAADFVQLIGALNYAKADNLLAVSGLVNTGHVVQSSGMINGYADRAIWLKRWKDAML